MAKLVCLLIVTHVMMATIFLGTGTRGSAAAAKGPSWPSTVGKNIKEAWAYIQSNPSGCSSLRFVAIHLPSGKCPAPPAHSEGPAFPMEVDVLGVPACTVIIHVDNCLTVVPPAPYAYA